MFIFQKKKYRFPKDPRASVAINHLGNNLKQETAVKPFQGVFSGFVDVPKGEIFYTVIEARKNVEKAPVIVYLLGGPGAPSSPFLACGLGPYQIQKDEKKKALVITDNPNTWAENATLILIDNPRGCGYSQVTNGEYVTTAEEAAQDLQIAIPMILKQYSLEQLPLYIGGISYGGTYVPFTAQALMNAGHAIAGLIIASGYTDPVLILNSYVESYIQRGFLFPNERALLSAYLSEFVKLVKDGNYEEAANYVDDTGKILTYIQSKTGIVNWLNLLTPFGNDPKFTTIMNAVQFMTEGRNLFPIGESPFNAASSSGIDWNVYDNLKVAMAKSAFTPLKELIQKGVSMLLMGGEYDGMVPFDATDALLQMLKKNKAIAELLKDPATSQLLKDEKGGILGYYRSSQMGSQIIFQGIIRNSGHMVDVDQPIGTKELVDLFLESV